MSDNKPVSKIRQPRIVYHIDDPEMAQVEKLRAYGAARKLNAIYIEALKIGAEILLQKLEQPNARIPVRTRFFMPELQEVSRETSVVQPQVPATAPAPVQAVPPESVAPPPAVVIPPMPAEPRIKPSLSAAAAAQFQRFGN